MRPAAPDGSDSNASLPRLIAASTRWGLAVQRTFGWLWVANCRQWHGYCACGHLSFDVEEADERPVLVAAYSANDSAVDNIERRTAWLCRGVCSRASSFRRARFGRALGFGSFRQP